MRIRVRKADIGVDGNDHYVFYEKGKFDKPLFILDNLSIWDLFRSIAKELGANIKGRSL